jgi:hypothetical protein
MLFRDKGKGDYIRIVSLVHSKLIKENELKEISFHFSGNTGANNFCFPMD